MVGEAGELVEPEALVVEADNLVQPVRRASDSHLVRGERAGLVR
jgi:hypothetical protein